MPESKRISADISDAGDQPRAILVRLTPEIAARVEAAAQERGASPTEIVRSIVAEHYNQPTDTSAVIGELRALRKAQDDRFWHLVYEHSRTRCSLYSIAEEPTRDLQTLLRIFEEAKQLAAKYVNECKEAERLSDAERQ
ncbi:MAG: hypothetical protein ACLQU2_17820 [Candidatus Binataceae bacterium]